SLLRQRASTRLMTARSLFTGAAKTTVTNFALAGVGLCSGVLVARALGPSGRGELAAIQMLPGTIATIATLGTSDSLVYFVANRKLGRAEALTAHFIVSSVIACVLMAVVALRLSWLLAAQSAATQSLALWFLFWLTPLLIVESSAHVLRS